MKHKKHLLLNVVHMIWLHVARCFRPFDLDNEVRFSMLKVESLVTGGTTKNVYLQFTFAYIHKVH